MQDFKDMTDISEKTVIHFVKELDDDIKLILTNEDSSSVLMNFNIDSNGFIKNSESTETTDPGSNSGTSGGDSPLIENVTISVGAGSVYTTLKQVFIKLSDPSFYWRNVTIDLISDLNETEILYITGVGKGVTINFNGFKINVINGITIDKVSSVVFNDVNIKGVSASDFYYFILEVKDSVVTINNMNIEANQSNYWYAFKAFTSTVYFNGIINITNIDSGIGIWYSKLHNFSEITVENTKNNAIAIVNSVWMPTWTYDDNYIPTPVIIRSTDTGVYAGTNSTVSIDGLVIDSAKRPIRIEDRSYIELIEFGGDTNTIGDYSLISKTSSYYTKTGVNFSKPLSQT